MNTHSSRTCAIAGSLLALSTLFSLSAVAGSAHTGPVEPPSARAAFEAATVDLPLAFEPDSSSESSGFLARGDGYRLHLSATEALLSLAGAPHETTLHMSFPGADAKSAPLGQDEMAMKSNYLVGDESAWRRDVPNYAKVAYRNLYRGVDLVYYGHHGQLEYDFVVAPGADAKVIRMAFPGAEDVRVEESSGDLLIRTAEQMQIRHQRPRIYQESAKGKAFVEGHYHLVDRNTVAFSVSAYDPTKALIIDPTVSFNVLERGNELSVVYGITVDSAGNTYLTGNTYATNSTFPRGTPDGSERFTNAACAANPNCPIPFFMKLASSGAIVYTTFFGGAGDQPFAIANDSTWAYIVGGTSSLKFTNPDGGSLKGGAMQVNGQSYAKGVPNPADFVGSLPINAFLEVFDLGTGQPQRYVIWGGTSQNTAYAVAVDAAQNAYITGETCASDYPTSALLGGKPYQKHLHGECAAFVTKIDPNNSIKNGYSTYLSGSGTDYGSAIVLESDGSTWITGAAFADFPATNTSHAGGTNGQKAFVTHLSADGSQILSSTIFGAPGQSATRGAALVSDNAGGVYLAGTAYIDSPSDYIYTTTNAVQPTLPCTGRWLECDTGFVSHVDLNGNVTASTYLGGSANAANNTIGSLLTQPTSIGRNRSGEIYVGGATSTSIGFPGAPAINPTSTAGFVTHLTSSLTNVVSTTFTGNSVNGLVVTEPSLVTTLNPTTTIYATGDANEDDPGLEGVFATKLLDSAQVVSRQ